MNSRWLFGGIALVCASLLAYGFYLQYVEFLDPCPLCMVQRVFFAAIGVTALLGFFHGGIPKFYAAVVALFALLGAGVAGRQIWLQHTPGAEMLECGAGLGTMLNTLPFFEVIATVLKGTGDCATVVWTFLGLSIPEWAILCFIAILLSCVLVLRKKGSRNPYGSI